MCWLSVDCLTFVEMGLVSSYRAVLVNLPGCRIVGHIEKITEINTHDSIAAA